MRWRCSHRRDRRRRPSRPNDARASHHSASGNGQTFLKTALLFSCRKRDWNALGFRKNLFFVCDSPITVYFFFFCDYFGRPPPYFFSTRGPVSIADNSTAATARFSFFFVAADRVHSQCLRCVESAAYPRSRAARPGSSPAGPHAAHSPVGLPFVPWPRSMTSRAKPSEGAPETNPKTVKPSTSLLSRGKSCLSTTSPPCEALPSGTSFN